MDIDVMIDPIADTCVRIRWIARLDGGLIGVQRDLEAELDGLDGVESVVMTRYSALVYLAPHITTETRILQELKEVFLPGSPLFDAPSVRLNKVQFRTIIVGGKLVSV